MFCGGVRVIVLCNVFWPIFHGRRKKKKKKEAKKKGDRIENYAYSVRIFCGGNTRCEINVLKIQLRDVVLCN